MAILSNCFSNGTSSVGSISTDVHPVVSVAQVLLAGRQGPIAQLVEHRADNAGVTGSIPVRPTTNSHFNYTLIKIADSWTNLGSWSAMALRNAIGAVAQMGERLICIQEVRGSIPLCSTVSLG